MAQGMGMNGFLYVGFFGDVFYDSLYCVNGQVASFIWPGFEEVWVSVHGLDEVLEFRHEC